MGGQGDEAQGEKEKRPESLGASRLPGSGWRPRRCNWARRGYPPVILTGRRGGRIIMATKEEMATRDERFATAAIASATS
ncbi:MAG: hypothetical protein M3442_04185 [Chloroflexota bacterium]|nr:hypothetical protein [Chloroflexota bacterium]